MSKELSFSMEKRRKNIVIALDVFLILGLLSYVIIFFIINKTLNPADIFGSSAVVEQRLFWRDFAEKIYAACSVVYILGHILVIYNAIIKKIRVSFKSVVIYFSIQIGIMLFCVVPVGLFDYAYFGDYLFPLRNLVVILSLLLVFSMATLVRRQ